MSCEPTQFETAIHAVDRESRRESLRDAQQNPAACPLPNGAKPITSAAPLAVPDFLGNFVADSLLVTGLTGFMIKVACRAC